MGSDWITDLLVSTAMAENPKATCRLSLINHAYLAELAKVGPYGSNKSDVVRRFIEDGIKAAIENGVIKQKDIEQFGGPAPDED